jgi:hypothetical protein
MPPLLRPPADGSGSAQGQCKPNDENNIGRITMNGRKQHDRKSRQKHDGRNSAADLFAEDTRLAATGRQAGATGPAVVIGRIDFGLA